MVVAAFQEVTADGELIRRFHSGQMRAWESTKRFVILSGSTQVGKTCFGPHWLEREIDNTGSQGDYLAVTATFKLLKLKMQPEFLNLFERTLDLGVWHESDRIFTSHDRYHGAEAWRVIFVSATNPEGAESATAKAAWCDELGQHQFKRETWEAITRRLTLAQGRVLGTTTLYELGWLKTELYDRWKNGDTDIDWIEVDALVNPVFPRAEYERQKPRYDALRALIDARLRAKLTQAELAARMGVSQSVVARLEGAGSSPRIDTLAAAATAMGCELEVKFKKRRRPAA